ncbi:MAG TPA: SRPBCC domain-containing protein, partial [Vicinamibacterales bacterium]
GPDGSTYSFMGVYREVVVPARLVLATRDPRSGVESVGTLVFSEHARKTTLTMTIEWHSMADRDAMLKMGVAVGITRTLDNLDEYLGTMG